MKFRFTLTDPLGGTKIISEPGGWDTAALTLERHPQFLSLVEYYKSSFQTYGSNGSEDGGRDWILAAEATFGPDALIAVLVELDNNDTGIYQTVYDGNLGIGLFVETLNQDHLLQIVFANQDFWSKFIARLTNQVDIRGTQTETERAHNLPGSLTPVPYFNLPLPTQKIDKGYKGFQKFNKVVDMYDQVNNSEFVYDLVDFDTDILDEIPTKFKYGWTPTEDNSPFGLFVVSDSGDFEIDLSVTLAIPDNSRDAAGPSSGGLYFFDSSPWVSNRTQAASGAFDVYIQLNGNPPIKATASNRSVSSGGFYLNNGLFIAEYFSFVTDYTLQTVFQGLKKNDQIKVFAKRSAAYHARLYESGGSTGIVKYPLFVFGSNGISNDDYDFILSGFTNINNVNFYSQLIEPAYLSTGPSYNPDPMTGLPTFNTRDSTTLQPGDTFIIPVGGANVINGIQTEVGWVLQFLGSSTGVSSPPTITCNTGSAIVNFSNVNLFGLYVVLFDPSGNLIGAIRTWNTTTQATLTTNARLTLAASAIKYGGWHISPTSLLNGCQNYGRTFLSVTYHTTALDAATGLFVAAGTNAYSFNDNNVTAYVIGLTLFVQFQNANTGASTLDINSLGAIPIKHKDGAALVANDIISTLVASGTNTYAVSNPFFLSLQEGIAMTVQFTNANTAASTLALNSFGAKSLFYKGNAIGAGQILAGQILNLVYDGTNFEIQDNNGLVTGQIYVLNYDGAEFIISPLASTDQITPTANKTAQAFLTHDVMAGIVDRITDEAGLFHSEHFGNRWTSPAYPADGCGSLTANLKGLHVRGFTLPEKSFFSSAHNWHDGINPIECIGIGYEPVSGINKIVCEPVAHFFDKSSMSILLSNVQTITRSYDPDWQFNSVDYGYSKWESQDQNGTGIPSGIDDPQAGRTRNTLFKIIGKKLSIVSSWIAAGLAIETIRRKGSVQTANYTYDNDTVVIKLRSNGDGTFTPELNENFSSITNLKNAETRYNSSIAPIRNFLRWLPLISGCLQDYLTSFFTFASGTGNYNMGSTMTGSCPGDDNGINHVESENVPVSSTFVFLPKPFEIEHYMDFDDYVTLRDNKNKAIGISQTDSGHVAFFLKSLNYVISTGLLKLTAWPTADFKITVPDTFSTVNSALYLLTDEGIVITTDDGTPILV